MTRVLLAMIRREYWVRARKRRFLLGTLMTPFVWLALFATPILLVTRGGGERRVTVLDQSGDPELYGEVQQALRAVQVGTTFVLSRIEVPADAELEPIRRQRTESLASDSDRACLVLGKNVLLGADPEYYARNVTDTSIANLGSVVSDSILTRRLARAGVDPARAAALTKRARMRLVKVTPHGEAPETGQAFLTAGAVVLILFSTVLGHSASVLHGVIEEKESRIIEVLITTVEPYQIMVSKLVGIGLVGLTQYGIWGACGALLYGILAVTPKGAELGWSAVGGTLLVPCMLFFLLGYFLFATLYLIVGAMASRPEDAHQLARPLFVLNILPWLIFYTVMKDPNSVLSVTLSMIPFFTPTMMMVRIVVGSPPLWQVALSILLTSATIGASLWVAARVYRAGILIYGKRLTLRELRRWLSYR